MRPTTLAAFLMAAGMGFGQTAATPPSFDVVSIKPSPPPIETKDDYSAGYNAGMRAGLAARGIRVTGLRVNISDTTLRDLIRQAWQLKDYQIIGPPAMTATKFDIVATMPEGSTRDQAPAMLRKALEERFHLKFHRETRDLPVYALVAEKKGAKLTPAAPQTTGHWEVSAPPGAARHVRAYRATLAAFADQLTPLLDRPVINMTEIEGTFDFDVSFSPDLSATTDSGPSLANAIRDQLGLRLEARKHQVEVLIIDSADKLPIEN